MLTVWRRHNPKKCKYTSRFERRCACPCWVGGSIDGSGEIRKSLRTNDWEKATERVRRWQVEHAEPSATNKVTLADWKERFMQDVESRKLANETARKYRLMFKQLEAFARTRRIVFVSDFGVDECSQFRHTWTGDGALSAGKKLERLRSAFRFAVSRGWMKTNPARELKMPKAKPVPTLPFTAEEMERIIAAAEADADLLAFVYVQRYAGLRISDTVTLAVDALDKENRLTLHTEKTGQLVRVPLPPYVGDALRSIQRARHPYYFWSGHSKVQSACGVWSAKLADLFERAKVTNGHSHRFRDTFAVGLLEGGVSLENLSKLLGHESIRVTEKHYAPWVKTRQDKLEAEIYRVHVMGIEL